MDKHPLSVIIDHDPELFKALSDAGKLALEDGALAAKYKILTAMALDAAHGAANGVKALAMMALRAGATKQEILETIRVAYQVCGAGSVYTAAQGLDGVFGQAEKP